MQTKLCKKCGKQKPIEKFSRHSIAADGYQTWCKECGKLYKQEYRDEHGSSYNVLSRRRIRYTVLIHYGGDPPKCECCEEPRFEFLSIDHINGGGSRHRKAVGYGRLYEWLKQNGFPPGYRVLCHNCNQAYGMYGYCPHQSPSRAILAKPVDQRTQIGLSYRDKVMAAAVELVAAGLPLTIAQLMKTTGYSKCTVQKHRQHFKQEKT